MQKSQRLVQKPGFSVIAPWDNWEKNLDNGHGQVFLVWTTILSIQKQGQIHVVMDVDKEPTLVS